MSDLESAGSGGTSAEAMRLAVVVHPGMDAGAAANAAVIVAGGLRCEAFEAPIADADGNAHAAVRWNVVVLRAKSAAQMTKLLSSARQDAVQAVAFTATGQGLSNDFGAYRDEIPRRHTDALSVVAVGLFGSDAAVRGLTRSFSLLR